MLDLGAVTVVAPNTGSEPETSPRDPVNSPGRPGTIRYIGDYQLLEEIARGGMGVVYKARQVSLNRLVALKMILTGTLASETELMRFQAEAEAAANLDHPNIVPVYEIGEHEGQHFFSMELIAGPSLKVPMASGKLEPRAGVRLLARAARAVHHAHQHGILHRDLKPANILLDSEGEPHVSDFGLAKRFTPGSSLEERGVTLTGSVLGTPHYMAPEQAEGRASNATTATDIYSLGTILYEVLTSQPPFQGETPLQIMRKVLEEEPERPSSICHSIDRDLETICLKCLQKDPASRYRTALEFAEELERVLKGEPILARPVSTRERVWRWCRRRPALAALLTSTVLLLLVVAIGSSILAGRLASAQKKTDQRSKEVRSALSRIIVSNGVRNLDQGDANGSLGWFIEAMRLDEDDPERQRMHRLRFGATLRISPRLVGYWSGNDAFEQFHFSPDRQSFVAIGKTYQSIGLSRLGGSIITLPVKGNGWVQDARFSEDGRSLFTFVIPSTHVPVGQLVGVEGWIETWDAVSGQKIGPPFQVPLTAFSGTESIHTGYSGMIPGSSLFFPALFCKWAVLGLPNR